MDEDECELTVLASAKITNLLGTDGRAGWSAVYQRISCGRHPGAPSVVLVDLMGWVVISPSLTYAQTIQIPLFDLERR